MGALYEEPLPDDVLVSELALGEIIAEEGVIIDISHNSTSFMFVVASEYGVKTVTYDRDARVKLA